MDGRSLSTSCGGSRGASVRVHGQPTLAAGVIVGSDLAYWAEALRFAGSIVARQQFLPGLTTGSGARRATWDPIFMGTDAERMPALAGRMPAAARALSEPGAAAPERPSTEVLRQFVATLTDHLVRAAASDASPLTGRRRRSSHPSTACTTPGFMPSGRKTGPLREMRPISPSSPHRSASGGGRSRFRKVPSSASVSAWRNRKIPRGPMTRPPMTHGTSATCSSLTTIRAFSYR